MADIQHFEIQRCFTTRMARTSPLAEELEPAIKAEAPHIARCIDVAPPWNLLGPPQQRTSSTRAAPARATAAGRVPRFTAG